jgi:hypothetical protein
MSIRLQKPAQTEPESGEAIEQTPFLIAACAYPSSAIGQFHPKNCSTTKADP